MQTGLTTCHLGCVGCLSLRSTLVILVPWANNTKANV